MHTKRVLLCVGLHKASPKLKFVLYIGILHVFLFLCFDNRPWSEELL
jgi:hypothetical protein